VFFGQNCLKTIPLESQAIGAKRGPFLVFPTVRSYSKIIYLHVHQILDTHSLPFAIFKAKEKVFFPCIRWGLQCFRGQKNHFFK
jgi:hypothetical protein